MVVMRITLMTALFLVGACKARDDYPVGPMGGIVDADAHEVCIDAAACPAPKPCITSAIATTAGATTTLVIETGMDVGRGVVVAVDPATPTVVGGPAHITTKQAAFPLTGATPSSLAVVVADNGMTCQSAITFN